MKLLPLIILLMSCATAPEKPRMKNVFLDVGAATGVSIDAFKTTRIYKETQWQIYAVEPSPEFSRQILRAPDVTVISEAAWLYDGNIEFFKATPTGDTRNSIFPHKDYTSTKVVWKCFDFTKWLRQNFRKEDLVILSLDIAGGEPAILERMLEDGTIDLIDRVYVEFSMEMLAEENSEEDKKQYQRIKKITDQIRERGILFDSDSVEDVIGERNTWIDRI